MNFQSVDTFFGKNPKKITHPTYLTDLMRENRIIFPVQKQKTMPKGNWKHAFYRF